MAHWFSLESWCIFSSSIFSIYSCSPNLNVREKEIQPLEIVSQHLDWNLSIFFHDLLPIKLPHNQTFLLPCEAFLAVRNWDSRLKLEQDWSSILPLSKYLTIGDRIWGELFLDSWLNNSQTFDSSIAIIDFPYMPSIGSF